MTSPWKIAGAALLGLFLMVGLARSCGYGQPIVIPNWADSLANVRDAYTMDSVYWAEQHEADSLRAENFRATAEDWRRRSLSSRPARPPRVGTTPPDSGTGQGTGQLDSIADVNHDSASVIAHLQAANDSLWAALDLADSAYSNLVQAYSEQVQATADARAGWARADTALADQAKVGRLAIADLTLRLRKAERGCRVLGLLPCPQISAGYGLTLADGKVRQGPTLSVSIPVRF